MFSIATKAASSSAFSPIQLFGSTALGAWYDPSDLSTMFQDSVGTTPVTATGQTVGLLLDKSQGLVRGPELVTNGAGGFSGTTGWVGGTISESGGRLTLTGAGGADPNTRLPLSGYAANKWFEISGNIFSAGGSPTNSNYIRLINGNGSFVNAVGWVGASTYTGPFRAIVSVPAGWTGMAISVQRGGNPVPVGTTLVLSDISVKELPGNHATQATAASRPIYGIEPFGGRRNLATFTEQFDNAAWTKTRAILTPDATTAPDGTLTADRIEPNATHPSAAGLVFQSITISAGATVNGSFYFKAGNATWAMFRVDDNGATNTANIWFNIATGAVGTTSTTGSGVGVSSGAVVSVGNGWYRCSAAFTTTAVTTIRFYAYGAVDANGSTASTLGNFAFIWGAQLETGSTATAYQRVTDQWNVTQAGVPSVSYLAFDGTDDFLLTGTITPGTDKAQVFAGVRKLSDAAPGSIVGLSVLAPANTGAFELLGPSNTATPDYRWTTRGTITSTIAPSGFAAPVTNVMTGIGDIAADTTILRANGVQVATSIDDQGTGNYLAYPLYIGRRGNNTTAFNGRIYQMIVRFGANLAAATITQTETFVNSRTGAY